MKQGFTLIELLVALVIASVIITLLFNSFFQTIGIIERADNLISINTRAILVQHHLEKDIMGAFLPVQAIKEKKKPSAKSDEKKEELPVLKKIFYGVNSGTILDTLTFITNNPMSAYWSKQIGKAKPKIARVVYRLVENKERKGSYTLLRQEGSTLEFEAYGIEESNKIRAHELADGIKELSIRYKVMLEPEEESVKKPKKKEIRFKTFDQWNMEKELPKNIKRRIPNMVDISISFWDTEGKRDVSFAFSIPIISAIVELPIEKDQPQDQKQTGTQPQPPQQGTGRNPKSPLLNVLKPKGTP